MQQSIIPSYWQQAIAELSERDAIMAEIIAQYKGETLVSRGDAFFSLARSIVGQQVSVKAADSIWRMFEQALGAINAQSIHLAREEVMRDAGLSRQKVAYLKDLAGRFIEGSIGAHMFPNMSDDEVIKVLTEIKGIGRWTAEMFLIFHLQRPDIFPIDDIGLQKAIERHYNDTSEALGETWRPWRTVATWYLWRSLDPVPVEY